MQEKPISELLLEAHILADHIVNAMDCIGQVEAMHLIFSMEQHKDFYKKAPHFFLTARNAMVYRFQLEVAKLFDTDSDTIAFPPFKDAIARGKHIGKNFLTRYKTLYKQTKSSINNIQLRRNKMLAHANYNASHDILSFQKELPFDLDQMKELLLTMLEICNKVIQKYTNGAIELHAYFGNDDFVRLFGYETEAEKVIRQELCGTHDQL